MSLQNPMNITGPGWPGNYTQSDYRIPTVAAGVASYSTGANMQLLTWPIAAYVQPNAATNVTKAQLSGGALGISSNGPFG